MLTELTKMNGQRVALLRFGLLSFGLLLVGFCYCWYCCCCRCKLSEDVKQSFEEKTSKFIEFGRIVGERQCKQSALCINMRSLTTLLYNMNKIIHFPIAQFAGGNLVHHHLCVHLCLLKLFIAGILHASSEPGKTLAS